MKIKYVQLESDAFLTDLDFVQFSPAERGIYCSLILFLNSNDGKCEFNPAALAKMCNCTGREFEKIWKKIEKKFQTRDGVIRHKRVSRELRKAKKLRQAKRRAGLNGSKKRWHSHDSDNDETMTKEREGKETKSKGKENNTSNSNNQSCSSSNSVRARSTEDCREKQELKSEFERFKRNFGSGPRGCDELIPSPAQLEQRRQSQLKSLSRGSGYKVATVSHPLRDREVTQWLPPGENDIGTRVPPAESTEKLPKESLMGVQALNFHESLLKILIPRSRSDRTCFRNVTNWLVAKHACGKFGDEIFNRVLDFAREAREGNRPAAVFMALLKKELGYGREI